jgi:hypothetical protein
MKFVLLVEGETERRSLPEFLGRGLNQQLNKKVGIDTIDMRGWSNFTKEVRKRTHTHLDSPRANSIIAVIGLLDLYAPTFYPNLKASSDEKHDWAVNHFESLVDRARFRMFFAVHEIEAWILSQPNLLPQPVQSSLPGSIAHPETVNHDQPPSHRLKQAYRDKLKTTYKKTTDGVNSFRQLDPAVVAQKCPRFHQMLNEMLALAQAAGN